MLLLLPPCPVEGAPAHDPVLLQGPYPPPAENLTFSLLSAVQRFLQGRPGDLRGPVPPAAFLPL